MIRRTKQAAQALFHYAGGTAWVRRRFQGAIRILMYHRFPKDSHFEAQCAHLRKHYQPISLTDAANRLREGKAIPEGLVVVTVDDGYRDFLEIAFPVLSRYNIPATIFLTTDLPDHETWLWVDQVTHCFQQTKVREAALNILEQKRWMLDTEERRTQVATSFKEALKRIPNDDRLAWLEQLPLLLEVDLPAKPPASYAPLRWDDVRTLVGNGVEFGAHTRTHPILSRLSSADQLEMEICGSKRRIEEEASIEVRHFCYPNGTPADFTQQAVEIAKEGGFVSAVTASCGVNRAGANPFKLSRIHVDAMDEDLAYSLAVAGRHIERAIPPDG